MIKFSHSYTHALNDRDTFFQLERGGISVAMAIHRVEKNNGIPEGTISRNEFISEVLSLGYKIREER